MPPGGPGGMRGPNRFLTEEEKKNRPRITKALLKRIFSYLLPYWPQSCHQFLGFCRPFSLERLLMRG